MERKGEVARCDNPARGINALSLVDLQCSPAQHRQLCCALPKENLSRGMYLAKPCTDQLHQHFPKNLSFALQRLLKH